MNTLYQQTSVSVETLEASCFNYLNWIASFPKIERDQQNDVTLISANAPVLYFNAAIQPGFHGNTEQRIEQTKEYFLDRGKSFNWLITPSSQPQNLAQYILQQGGEFLEAVPYMVLQLDEMRRETTAPPDFHTELVRSTEMLHAWTLIYCQARSYSYGTDQLFDVLSDVPLEDGAALQLLLGYLDNQPVATYSVFLDEEIAGFYSLTTLPEFRGQGLGTAISIAAADLAVDHGFESVMLLSEPLSRNLCKRMGFVETPAAMEILRMSAS